MFREIRQPYKVKDNNCLFAYGKPVTPKIFYNNEDEKHRPLKVDKLRVTAVYYNGWCADNSHDHGLSRSFSKEQTRDAQKKLASLQRGDTIKECFRSCMAWLFDGNLFDGKAPSAIALPPRHKQTILDHQKDEVNDYIMEKYEGITPRPRIVSWGQGWSTKREGERPAPKLVA